MRNNKISSTNNSKEFIKFLNELSERIKEGNDKAHKLNLDQISEEFLIKIFPKNEDALKILFKMNINDAIKFENEIANYIPINKNN